MNLGNSTHCSVKDSVNSSFRHEVSKLTIPSVSISTRYSVWSLVSSAVHSTKPN